MALNEQVRQALERIWHAERGCLAAQQVADGARSAYNAAGDRLAAAEHSAMLARQELGRCFDVLHDLAKEAAEQEAQ